jgi:hypothetical protein
MNYLLYFVFCAVCIVSVSHSIWIKRYVRSAHPTLWARFGFSGNGWWVPASKEEKGVESDLSFWGYLSSHGSELNDKSLNRMLRTRRVLHVIGAFLFVVAIFAFAVRERA